MTCPNLFTCFICKKDYHGITPMEQMLKEHEERKKTVNGYDDGTDDVAQVCDHCFQAFLKPAIANQRKE